MKHPASVWPGINERRDLLRLVLFILLSTLPFLNRAIHLDENTYLSIARHVTQNFWFPQDFQGLWFGIPFLNLGGHTHPTGLAYYLALLLQLFQSETEWKLRLGFLVFPLLYAIGAYGLARRMTRSPLTTALLIMATPAVLVFSLSLMPDLPMAVFWLWSVLFFMSGLEREGIWRLMAAGFLLVLATWISYQALFMSGLLAVYAASRRDFRIKIYLALLLPFFFLLLYWWAGRQHYGFWQAERGGQFLANFHIFGVEFFRQKFIGMFSTLGATTIFGFSILWVFYRSEGRGLFALSVLGTLLSCLLVPRGYSLWEYTEFFIFAVVGILLFLAVARVFVQVLKKMIRGRDFSADELLITLWILGVVVYTVLLCEFSAARYVVAIVPPLGIFFAWKVEGLNPGQRRWDWSGLNATVVATWILAWGIAFADYQYMGAFRDFSKWFDRHYGSVPGAKWVGSEAGLRYYMERVGARPLVTGYGPVIPGAIMDIKWGETRFGRPQLNDLLVRPESFLRYDLSPDLELSARIDSRSLQSRFPLRTYGPLAHAGLHGTNVGLLPFSFSLVPLDHINVYQYNIFAFSFSHAEAEAVPSNSVHQGFMPIAGKRQAVMTMPCPARITYAMTVPDHSTISGEFAVPDTDSPDSKCKPTLRIAARAKGERGEFLCGQVMLDPPRYALSGLTRSSKFLCSLNLFRNRPVEVIFETKCDLEENRSCPPSGLWNLRWVDSAGPIKGLE